MGGFEQPWRLVNYGDAGPAPGAVVSALLQVLADMQVPTVVDVRVGWSDGDGDGPSTLWIQERGEESLTGVPVFLTDHEGLVEQIADQLQEQFFHETAAAWGQARPGCPGHAHAAVVGRVDGEAWWRCPVSGARLARVGSLNT